MNNIYKKIFNARRGMMVVVDEARMGHSQCGSAGETVGEAAGTGTLHPGALRLKRLAAAAMGAFLFIANPSFALTLFEEAGVLGLSSGNITTSNIHSTTENGDWTISDGGVIYLGSTTQASAYRWNGDNAIIVAGYKTYKQPYHNKYTHYDTPSQIYLDPDYAAANNIGMTTTVAKATSLTLSGGSALTLVPRGSEKSSYTIKMTIYVDVLRGLDKYGTWHVDQWQGERNNVPVVVESSALNQTNLEVQNGISITTAAGSASRTTLLLQNSNQNGTAWQSGTVYFGKAGTSNAGDGFNASNAQVLIHSGGVDGTSTKAASTIADTKFYVDAYQASDEWSSGGTKALTGAATYATSWRWEEQASYTKTFADGSTEVVTYTRYNGWTDMSHPEYSSLSRFFKTGGDLTVQGSVTRVGGTGSIEAGGVLSFVDLPDTVTLRSDASSGSVAGNKFAQVISRGGTLKGTSVTFSSETKGDYTTRSGTLNDTVAGGYLTGAGYYEAVAVAGDSNSGAYTDNYILATDSTNGTVSFTNFYQRVRSGASLTVAGANSSTKVAKGTTYTNSTLLVEGTETIRGDVTFTDSDVTIAGTGKLAIAQDGANATFTGGTLTMTDSAVLQLNNISSESGGKNTTFRGTQLIVGDDDGEADTATIYNNYWSVWLPDASLKVASDGKLIARINTTDSYQYMNLGKTDLAGEIEGSVIQLSGTLTATGANAKLVANGGTLTFNNGSSVVVTEGAKLGVSSTSAVVTFSQGSEVTVQEGATLTVTTPQYVWFESKTEIQKGGALVLNVGTNQAAGLAGNINVLGTLTVNGKINRTGTITLGGTADGETVSGALQATGFDNNWGKTTIVVNSGSIGNTDAKGDVELSFRNLDVNGTLTSSSMGKWTLGTVNIAGTADLINASSVATSSGTGDTATVITFDGGTADAHSALKVMKFTSDKLSGTIRTTAGTADSPLYADIQTVNGQAVDFSDTTLTVAQNSVLSFYSAYGEDGTPQLGEISALGTTTVENGGILRFKKATLNSKTLTLDGVMEGELAIKGNSTVQGGTEKDLDVSATHIVAEGNLSLWSRSAVATDVTANAGGYVTAGNITVKKGGTLTSDDIRVVEGSTVTVLGTQTIKGDATFTNANVVILGSGKLDVVSNKDAAGNPTDGQTTFTGGTLTFADNGVSGETAVLDLNEINAENGKYTVKDAVFDGVTVNIGDGDGIGDGMWNGMTITDYAEIEQNSAFLNLKKAKLNVYGDAHLTVRTVAGDQTLQSIALGETELAGEIEASQIYTWDGEQRVTSDHAVLTAKTKEVKFTEESSLTVQKGAKLTVNSANVFYHYGKATVEQGGTLVINTADKPASEGGQYAAAIYGTIDVLGTLTVNADINRSGTITVGGTVDGKTVAGTFTAKGFDTNWESTTVKVIAGSVGSTDSAGTVNLSNMILDVDGPMTGSSTGAWTLGATDIAGTADLSNAASVTTAAGKTLNFSQDKATLSTKSFKTGTTIEEGTVTGSAITVGENVNAFIKVASTGTADLTDSTVTIGENGSLTIGETGGTGKGNAKLSGTTVSGNLASKDVEVAKKSTVTGSLTAEGNLSLSDSLQLSGGNTSSDATTLTVGTVSTKAGTNAAIEIGTDSSTSYTKIMSATGGALDLTDAVINVNKASTVDLTGSASTKLGTTNVKDDAKVVAGKLGLEKTLTFAGDASVTAETLTASTGAAVNVESSKANVTMTVTSGAADLSAGTVTVSNDSTLSMKKGTGEDAGYADTKLGNTTVDGTIVAGNTTLTAGKTLTLKEGSIVSTTGFVSDGTASAKNKIMGEETSYITTGTGSATLNNTEISTGSSKGEVVFATAVTKAEDGTVTADGYADANFNNVTIGTESSGTYTGTKVTADDVTVTKGSTVTLLGESEISAKSFTKTGSSTDQTKINVTGTAGGTTEAVIAVETTPVDLTDTAVTTTNASLSIKDKDGNAADVTLGDTSVQGTLSARKATSEAGTTLTVGGTAAEEKGTLNLETVEIKGSLDLGVSSALRLTGGTAGEPATSSIASLTAGGNSSITGENVNLTVGAGSTEKPSTMTVKSLTVGTEGASSTFTNKGTVNAESGGITVAGGKFVSTGELTTGSNGLTIGTDASAVISGTATGDKLTLGSGASVSIESENVRFKGFDGGNGELEVKSSVTFDTFTYDKTATGAAGDEKFTFTASGAGTKLTVNDTNFNFTNADLGVKSGADLETLLGITTAADGQGGSTFVDQGTLGKSNTIYVYAGASAKAATVNASVAANLGNTFVVSGGTLYTSLIEIFTGTHNSSYTDDDGKEIPSKGTALTGVDAVRSTLGGEKGALRFTQGVISFSDNNWSASLIGSVITQLDKSSTGLWGGSGTDQKPNDSKTFTARFVEFTGTKGDDVQFDVDFVNGIGASNVVFSAEELKNESTVGAGKQTSETLVVGSLTGSEAAVNAIMTESGVDAIGMKGITGAKTVDIRDAKTLILVGSEKDGDKDLTDYVLVNDGSGNAGSVRVGEGSTLVLGKDDGKSTGGQLSEVTVTGGDLSIGTMNPMTEVSDAGEAAGDKFKIGKLTLTDTTGGTGAAVTVAKGSTLEATSYTDGEKSEVTVSGKLSIGSVTDGELKGAYTNEGTIEIKGTGGSDKTVTFKQAYTNGGTDEKTGEAIGGTLTGANDLTFKFEGGLDNGEDSVIDGVKGVEVAGNAATETTWTYTYTEGDQEKTLVVTEKNGKVTFTDGDGNAIAGAVTLDKETGVPSVGGSALTNRSKVSETSETVYTYTDEKNTTYTVTVTKTNGQYTKKVTAKDGKEVTGDTLKALKVTVNSATGEPSVGATTLTDGTKTSEKTTYTYTEDGKQKTVVVTKTGDTYTLTDGSGNAISESSGALIGEDDLPTIDGKQLTLKDKVSKTSASVNKGTIGSDGDTNTVKSFKVTGDGTNFVNEAGGKIYAGDTTGEDGAGTGTFTVEAGSTFTNKGEDAVTGDEAGSVTIAGTMDVKGTLGNEGDIIFKGKGAGFTSDTGSSITNEGTITGATTADTKGSVKNEGAIGFTGTGSSWTASGGFENTTEGVITDLDNLTVTGTNNVTQTSYTYTGDDGQEKTVVVTKTGDGYTVTDETGAEIAGATVDSGTGLPTVGEKTLTADDKTSETVTGAINEGTIGTKDAGLGSLNVGSGEDEGSFINEGTMYVGTEGGESGTVTVTDGSTLVNKDKTGSAGDEHGGKLIVSGTIDVNAGGKVKNEAEIDLTGDAKITLGDGAADKSDGELDNTGTIKGAKSIRGTAEDPSGTVKNTGSIDMGLTGGTGGTIAVDTLTNGATTGEGESAVTTPGSITNVSTVVTSGDLTNEKGSSITFTGKDSDSLTTGGNFTNEGTIDGADSVTVTGSDTGTTSTNKGSIGTDPGAGRIGTVTIGTEGGSKTGSFTNETGGDIYTEHLDIKTGSSFTNETGGDVAGLQTVTSEGTLTNKGNISFDEKTTTDTSLTAKTLKNEKTTGGQGEVTGGVITGLDNLTLTGKGSDKSENTGSIGTTTDALKSLDVGATGSGDAGEFDNYGDIYVEGSVNVTDGSTLTNGKDAGKGTGSLVVEGTVDVSAGGKVDNDGEITLTGDAAINLSDGSAAGKGDGELDNSGIITGAKSIGGTDSSGEGSGKFTNTGSVSMTGDNGRGGSITVETFENKKGEDGTGGTVTGVTTVTTSGDMKTGEGSSITFTGGEDAKLDVGGALTNEGTVSGVHDVDVDGNLTNKGKIEFTGDGTTDTTLTVDGAFENEKEGSITGLTELDITGEGTVNKGTLGSSDQNPPMRVVVGTSDVQDTDGNVTEEGKKGTFTNTGDITAGSLDLNKSGSTFTNGDTDSETGTLTVTTITGEAGTTLDNKSTIDGVSDIDDAGAVKNTSSITFTGEGNGSFTAGSLENTKGEDGTGGTITGVKDLSVTGGTKNTGTISFNKDKDTSYDAEGGFKNEGTIENLDDLYISGAFSDGTTGNENTGSIGGAGDGVTNLVIGEDKDGNTTSTTFTNKTPGTITVGDEKEEGTLTVKTGSSFTNESTGSSSSGDTGTGITVTGKVVVDDGGAFTNSGNIDFEGGSAAIELGAGTKTAENPGGTSDGSFTNEGKITGVKTITGTGDSGSGVTEGTFTNTGTVQMTGEDGKGGTIVVDTLNNAAETTGGTGGTITGVGSVTTGSGMTTGKGSSITFTGEDSKLDVGGDLTNKGTIENVDEVDVAGKLTNEGTLTFTGTGSDSRLTVEGTFTNTGTKDNDGNYTGGVIKGLTELDITGTGSTNSGKIGDSAEDPAMKVVIGTSDTTEYERDDQGNIKTDDKGNPIEKTVEGKTGEFTNTGDLYAGDLDLNKSGSSFTNETDGKTYVDDLTGEKGTTVTNKGEMIFGGEDSTLTTEGTFTSEKDSKVTGVGTATLTGSESTIAGSFTGSTDKSGKKTGTLNVGSGTDEDDGVSSKVTVTTDGSVNIGSINVGNGDTLENKGDVTADNLTGKKGATITNEGTAHVKTITGDAGSAITNETGGKIDKLTDVTAGGTFTNKGEMTFDGAVGDGEERTFTATGDFDNTGNIKGDVKITIDGSASEEGGTAKTQTNSGNIGGSGTGEAVSEVTIAGTGTTLKNTGDVYTGDMTVGEGSSFTNGSEEGDQSKGKVHITGTLTNQGDFQAASGDFENIKNEGSFKLTDTGSTGSNGTNVSGNVDNSSGSMDFGDGDVTIGGKVTNTGTPGDESKGLITTDGKLTISGGLDNGENATIDGAKGVVIGGSTDGTATSSNKGTIKSEATIEITGDITSTGKITGGTGSEGVKITGGTTTLGEGSETTGGTLTIGDGVKSPSGTLVIDEGATVNFKTIVGQTGGTLENKTDVVIGEGGSFTGGAGFSYIAGEGSSLKKDTGTTDDQGNKITEDIKLDNITIGTSGGDMTANAGKNNRIEIRAGGTLSLVTEGTEGYDKTSKVNTMVTTDFSQSDSSVKHYQSTIHIEGGTLNIALTTLFKDAQTVKENGDGISLDVEHINGKDLVDAGSATSQVSGVSETAYSHVGNLADGMSDLLYFAKGTIAFAEDWTTTLVNDVTSVLKAQMKSDTDTAISGDIKQGSGTTDRWVSFSSSSLSQASLNVDTANAITGTDNDDGNGIGVVFTNASFKNSTSGSSEAEDAAKTLVFGNEDNKSDTTNVVTTDNLGSADITNAGEVKITDGHTYVLVGTSGGSDGDLIRGEGGKANADQGTVNVDEGGTLILGDADTSTTTGGTIGTVNVTDANLDVRGGDEFVIKNLNIKNSTLDVTDGGTTGSSGTDTSLTVGSYTDDSGSTINVGGKSDASSEGGKTGGKLVIESIGDENEGKIKGTVTVKEGGELDLGTGSAVTGDPNGVTTEIGFEKKVTNEGKITTVKDETTGETKDKTRLVFEDGYDGGTGSSVTDVVDVTITGSESSNKGTIGGKGDESLKNLTVGTRDNDAGTGKTGSLTNEGNIYAENVNIGDDSSLTNKGAGTGGVDPYTGLVTETITGGEGSTITNEGDGKISGVNTIDTEGHLKNDGTIDFSGDGEDSEGSPIDKALTVDGGYEGGTGSKVTGVDKVTFTGTAEEGKGSVNKGTIDGGKDGEDNTKALKDFYVGTEEGANGATETRAGDFTNGEGGSIVAEEVTVAKDSSFTNDKGGTVSGLTDVTTTGGSVTNNGDMSFTDDGNESTKTSMTIDGTFTGGKGSTITGLDEATFTGGASSNNGTIGGTGDVLDSLTVGSGNGNNTGSFTNGGDGTVHVEDVTVNKGSTLTNEKGGKFEDLTDVTTGGTLTNDGEMNFTGGKDDGHGGKTDAKITVKETGSFTNEDDGKVSGITDLDADGKVKNEGSIDFETGSDGKAEATFDGGYEGGTGSKVTGVTDITFTGKTEDGNGSVNKGTITGRDTDGDGSSDLTIKVGTKDGDTGTAGDFTNEGNITSETVDVSDGSSFTSGKGDGVDPYTGLVTETITGGTDSSITNEKGGKISGLTDVTTEGSLTNDGEMSFKGGKDDGQGGKTDAKITVKETGSFTNEGDGKVSGITDLDADGKVKNDGSIDFETGSDGKAEATFDGGYEGGTGSKVTGVTDITFTGKTEEGKGSVNKGTITGADTDGDGNPDPIKNVTIGTKDADQGTGTAGDLTNEGNITSETVKVSDGSSFTNGKGDGVDPYTGLVTETIMGGTDSSITNEKGGKISGLTDVTTEGDLTNKGEMSFKGGDNGQGGRTDAKITIEGDGTFTNDEGGKISGVTDITSGTKITNDGSIDMEKGTDGKAEFTTGGDYDGGTGSTLTGVTDFKSGGNTTTDGTIGFEKNDEGNATMDVDGNFEGGTGSKITGVTHVDIEGDAKNDGSIDMDKGSDGKAKVEIGGDYTGGTGSSITGVTDLDADGKVKNEGTISFDKDGSGNSTADLSGGYEGGTGSKITGVTDLTFTGTDESASGGSDKSSVNKGTIGGSGEDEKVKNLNVGTKDADEGTGTAGEFTNEGNITSETVKISDGSSFTNKGAGDGGVDPYTGLVTGAITGGTDSSITNEKGGKVSGLTDVTTEGDLTNRGDMSFDGSGEEDGKAELTIKGDDSSFTNEGTLSGLTDLDAEGKVKNEGSIDFGTDKDGNASASFEGGYEGGTGSKVTGVTDLTFTGTGDPSTEGGKGAVNKGTITGRDTDGDGSSDLTIKVGTKDADTGTGTAGEFTNEGNIDAGQVDVSDGSSFTNKGAGDGGVDPYTGLVTEKITGGTGSSITNEKGGKVSGLTDVTTEGSLTNKGDMDFSGGDDGKGGVKDAKLTITGEGSFTNEGKVTGVTDVTSGNRVTNDGSMDFEKGTGGTATGAFTGGYTGGSGSSITGPADLTFTGTDESGTPGGSDKSSVNKGTIGGSTDEDKVTSITIGKTGDAGTFTNTGDGSVNTGKITVGPGSSLVNKTDGDTSGSGDRPKITADEIDLTGGGNVEITGGTVSVKDLTGVGEGHGVKLTGDGTLETGLENILTDGGKGSTVNPGLDLGGGTLRLTDEPITIEDLKKVMIAVGEGKDADKTTSVNVSGSIDYGTKTILSIGDAQSATDSDYDTTFRDANGKFYYTEVDNKIAGSMAKAQARDASGAEVGANVSATLILTGKYTSGGAKGEAIKIRPAGDLGSDNAYYHAGNIGFTKIDLAERSAKVIVSGGKTLTLTGESGGGKLLTGANGSEDTVYVGLSSTETVTVAGDAAADLTGFDKTGTLILGSENTDYAKGGTLTKVYVRSGSTLSVKGAPEKSGEYHIGSVDLTDSAVKTENGESVTVGGTVAVEGNLTVDEMTLTKGSKLSIGSSTSTGAFSASSLKLNGGTVILDPDWTKAASTGEFTIAAASAGAAADLDGTVIVGRNSQLAIGTGLTTLTSALSTLEMTAKEGKSHTFSEGDVEAALYVGQLISMSSSDTLAVKSSVTSVSDSAVSSVAKGVTVGSNSLLIVDGSLATSTTAVISTSDTLAFAVEDGGMIYVDNASASADGVLVASGFTYTGLDTAEFGAINRFLKLDRYESSNGSLTLFFSQTDTSIFGLLANVGTALNAGGASDTLAYKRMNALLSTTNGLTDGEVRSAFNGIALASVAGGTQTAAMNASTMVSDTLMEHVVSGQRENHQVGKQSWASLTGMTSRAGSYNAGSAEYGWKSDLTGISMGADYADGTNTVGLAASVGTGSVRGQGDGTGTKNKVEYFGAHLYGIHEGQAVDVSGLVGMTVLRSEVSQGGYKARPTSVALGAAVQLSHDFATSKNVTVTPHLGVRYTHLTGAKFTSGGFKYDSSAANLVEVPVGVRVSGNYETASGAVVKPTLDLSLSRSFGGTRVGQSLGAEGVDATDSFDAKINGRFTWGATAGIRIEKSVHSLDFGYGLKAGEDGRLDQHLKARYIYRF